MMKLLYDQILEGSFIRRSLLRQLFERSMEEINTANTEYQDIEDLPDLFELFYELEYKYNMLQSRPFVGHERRRENMIRIIEGQAEAVIESLAITFYNVFYDWLEKHALTDPQKWTDARFEEYEEGYDFTVENVVDNMVSEYWHNTDPNRMRAVALQGWEPVKRAGFKKILDIAEQKINEMPNFAHFVQVVAVPYEQERMYGDLRDEGLEEFNSMYGQNFKTTDAANDWIDNLDPQSIDWRDLMLFEDVDEFQSALEESFDYGSIFEVLKDFFRVIIFPLWYARLSAQGIEKTRSNIEKLFQQLSDIGSFPVQQRFAILNSAINSVHQGGSMMDYYEQQYDDVVNRRDLEALSNRDTSDWDNELREIGVQI